MLEEIGEIVVEEENKDESDGCNEDDKDDGVGEATFELDGGGVGGILDVNEVSGGTDLRVGSDRERVGEKDDEEHANGDRSHHADYLNSERIENTRLHRYRFRRSFWLRHFFGGSRGRRREERVATAESSFLTSSFMPKKKKLCFCRPTISFKAQRVNNGTTITAH